MEKTEDSSRDLDLIRDILLKLEANSFPVNSKVPFDIENETDLQFSGFSQNQVWRHLLLLIEAGFIHGTKTGAGILYEGITWNGHEYLDAIRNPDTWKKTKVVAKRAGGAGVSVIWDIAKSLIKHEVGKAIGTIL